MCDTYNCDYLKHSSEIQISLPNFAFFTVKSHSVTQRSVSQENAYKKSLAVTFSSQNYRLR